MQDLIVKAIPILVIIAVIAIIFLMGYVKAPTNEAYIISGLKAEPRVLIGRAGIKIPFFERKDTLRIQKTSIDIKTNGYIPTQDFVGVDIDAIAQVQPITYKDITVDDKGEWLPNVIVDDTTPRITSAMALAAMKNFLNMDEDQIIDALKDSLQGNMREIIGTQTLKDLCNDREGFGNQVQSKAQKDMNALGIYIVSCNIQRLEDERNLINDLGQDNMSKIKKDASIAKAKADAEVAVAESESKKTANDARVSAETEIATKNNELAITQANLKIEADRKKAEADAAYKIQEEEQRKSIEVAAADADIARQEKAIELKQKEVAVKEQELDATIRKQADAEKYAKQMAAEAELFERQKKAEAELFEKKQAADARKTQAEAEAYAEKQKAEAVRAIGEAEAEAIKAKGMAEAEAMDKKADAMAKYGQAALTEMVVNVLPEMARAIAEPIGSVDKISIIDGGSGNGVGSMYNMVSGGLAKTIESVKETTGLDLVEVMKADTYDAKVKKELNVTGMENATVNVDVKSKDIKAGRKESETVKGESPFTKNETEQF